jgi:hypothetical protein
MKINPSRFLVAIPGVLKAMCFGATVSFYLIGAYFIMRDEFAKGLPLMVKAATVLIMALFLKNLDVMLRQRRRDKALLELNKLFAAEKTAQRAMEAAIQSKATKNPMTN